MPIEKISGVYLDEEVDYELSGTGSKIPVFIGLTGNTGTSAYPVDGTNVLKFTQYDDLNKAEKKADNFAFILFLGLFDLTIL